MSPGKKIYFASDFHLGTPDHDTSLKRERAICAWLDSIKKDAGEIYLLGDIFDFWFEYRTAIPKGFIRLQGKLAELRDAGIPIHFFTGNHDMWMFSYFEKELGIPVYHKPVFRNFNGKNFMLGHGDGLGPGEFGYKLLKRFFRSKVCQWLFARLHPNLGIAIAHFWSRSSRAGNMQKEQFLGEEREYLVIYAKEKLREDKIDYFVFGHRHLPLDIKLNENSRYINLGDWITHNSYAVFDGEKMELLRFDSAAHRAV